MGERGHAAALLWLEHAPSIDLAIGPRQKMCPSWAGSVLFSETEHQNSFR